MLKTLFEDSWKDPLRGEFEKPYWNDLESFVREEYASKDIYPSQPDIFRAFELCPFDKVQVVIVGQDPYHGAGQANGLSFAVNDGVALPPSLRNIFKEIESDLGVKPFSSGNLSRWAEQGVLMLNSVLTVVAKTPASHKGKGWEIFTDSVIEALNEQKTGVVYILWGKYAQKKGGVIDRQKNCVLTSGHPSPFSAKRFFFGHHHFSRCNEYLKSRDSLPIDWR